MVAGLYRRVARDEDGFTMMAVVGGIALLSLLAAAAVAATNGDLNLTKRDLDQKRAYQAAQAGIADYTAHLNQDISYWQKCTSVPGPHALNQQRPNPGSNPSWSPTNWKSVPGSNDAHYAIELVPSQTPASSACNPSSPPFYGILESASSPQPFTFRIRSTGYAGGTNPSNSEARVSLVATIKRVSFLDYVYFTQYETSDPVTYPTSWIPGATQQCTKFRRDGRQSAAIPGSGGNYCNRIVFADDDEINGPLHTNDDLCINTGATPQFGRNASDVIEVSSWAPGHYRPSGSNDGCAATGGATPGPGSFKTDAPVLTPPPTNKQLENIAGPTYTFTGQSRIVLSGNSMTVTTSTGTVGPISVPEDGVVYVRNDPSEACSASYSPFGPDSNLYPSSSPCGNARVSGSYSGQLTIAAENDIVIWDDVCEGSCGNAPTGSAMLGLIANNFVRVRHQYPTQTSQSSGCGDGSGSVWLGTTQIDAAMLAIDHSFIVDHYNCGFHSSGNTLTVNGVISQKYRGPVGTTGGSGYLKDYNYDDRLRYLEPPHFLDPVQAAWHVQRETLDFP
jgi:Tfp pilus assembly protein PilX